MKRLIPFLLAGAAAISVGGVAMAAANSVSTTPAPAHVPEFRPAAATANLSRSTNDDSNSSSDDINDDQGNDINDANDDNGVATPASHDLNDDNGVDNPAS